MASWKERLLAWYNANKRDLPWRKTQELYPIWVSEVMLQQTQVATVIPFFERWMARFPTLESLAASTEEDVLSVWQGLGYYRRAKLLRKGAQYVIENGTPSTIVGWQKVPGVGSYTAAAIGSIAQSLPSAVVDGNVERVFARFRAHSETGSSLLKAAKSWANSELVIEHPSDWNQALMEHGAVICTPKNPKCAACPIEAECVARQTWSVDRYPASPPKAQTVREQHKVWVPYFEGLFGIRQIPEGHWWAGMWEFPRSTTGAQELQRIFGDIWPEEIGTFRHQVTHHKIEVEASLVRGEDINGELKWKTIAELEATPMPSPQRKVLKLALQALGLGT